MKFNNTPNGAYKVLDSEGNEKLVWESRSMAVCAAIIHAGPNQKMHILLGKRSNKMTFPGTWGLCCGFLDWDESLVQAAQREVYEELGLEFEMDDFEPYEISSDPRKFGQNVTQHFVTVLFNEEMPTPTPCPNEVVDARWFSREDIKNMGEDAFSFDHYNRILNLTHVHGESN